MLPSSDTSVLLGNISPGHDNKSLVLKWSTSWSPWGIR